MSKEDLKRSITKNAVTKEHKPINKDVYAVTKKERQEIENAINYNYYGVTTI